MTIVPLSNNRIEVIQESPGQSRLLGISTGVPAKGFAAQKITAAARGDAALATDDRLRPWRIVRVIPFEEHLYLCGPCIEGITVEELLENPAGPPSIEEGISAIIRAISENVDSGDYRFCNTATSLITPTGEVLLLPARLADEVNGYLPLPRRRDVLHPYRPSTLAPREQQVYLCGALIWEAITGTRLCTGADETISDACHQEVRRTAAIHRAAPETRSAISDALPNLFRSPSEVTAASLHAIAREIRVAGFREEIDDAETVRRRTAAEEMSERERRRMAGRTFLRTRGPRIALIAAAVVLAGTIPFHIVRARLTPPSIAGLPPAEVAAAYYDAWRALDHVVMDEALADGVGTGIVREVTNVFVMDRVQVAQTMESRLTPVDQWIAAGRPDDTVPYGPHALELRVRSRSETSVTLTADYQLWRPAPADEDTAGVVATRVLVETRRDVLELTPNRWGWEISRLDTTISGTEAITIGQ